MARLTDEERLQKLEEQKQKLSAKISKQKATLTAKKRKDDTRRKIIAGALALEHMEKDHGFRETMTRLLRDHVKESDKALFNPELSPPPAAPTAPQEQRHPSEFNRTS